MSELYHKSLFTSRATSALHSSYCDDRRAHARAHRFSWLLFICPAIGGSLCSLIIFNEERCQNKTFLCSCGRNNVEEWMLNLFCTVIDSLQINYKLLINKLVEKDSRIWTWINLNQTQTWLKPLTFFFPRKICDSITDTKNGTKIFQYWMM